jgi:IS5 family transposase
VDTTVVETNIHDPTDSTLLADGVRVLTRTLRQLGAPVRERTRSVARRVFEIAQRSRTTGARASQRVRERTKARMSMLYQGLMRITRTVVREAEAAVTQFPPRPRRRIRRLAERLHAPFGVVRQVLAQTRARVLHEDTHFPAKVVSVFEPHTEIIRKGKLAKPTEFGRRVMIQEAEAQFITDYQVCERQLSDRALWVPALDRHRALFGHPPQLAVADGGLASRKNERAAQDRACGTSCSGGSPRPGAPEPPAPRRAGARAARGASAPSSAVMGCGAVGTADRAACSAGSDSG